MMAEYQCFNAFDHVKNGINSSNLHVLFHSKSVICFCTAVMQWLLIEKERLPAKQQWYSLYLMFIAARPDLDFDSSQDYKMRLEQAASF